MKKLILLSFFLILLCNNVDCTQKHSLLSALSFDERIDFSKLKRRYPRKYNLKYNSGKKPSPDDFGYPHGYIQ